MRRWFVAGMVAVVFAGCGTAARRFGSPVDGDAGASGGGNLENTGGAEGAGQRAGGGEGTGDATNAAAGASDSAGNAGAASNGCESGCPAPDACHDAGTCNASTGTCDTPVVADGEPCGAERECVGGECLCTRTSCPNGCCSAAGACGACAPEPLAVRTFQVKALSIAASFLYFLETDDNDDALVYSLPTKGGTASVLSYPAPPSALSTIYADGSFIYGAPMDFSYPGTVGRMPILGGVFSAIAGSVTYASPVLHSNSKSIVASSTLSSTHINLFAKAGGSPVELTASQAVDSQHIAIDESYVYVFSSAGTAANRIPVGGEDASSVTAADAGETFKDMALSGSTLVLATSKRIATVAAAGGTAATIDPQGAYALIADETSAFYFRAKAANGSCSAGSELYSIPLAGGNLRRLAVDSASTCASSLVQDESAVYWLSGNTINKAAK